VQAARLTARLRADKDKLDKAYAIAVAALVISVLLTACLLVLVVVLLMRRGPAASACTTAPESKYEPHVDVELQHRNRR
jgi:hypothetical protein